MIKIESALLQVEINREAELQSVFDKKRNRECLWQGDAKYWKERSPLLFPFIGRLFQKAYYYNGEKYPMDVHGFLRSMQARIVDQEEDSCTLEFRDSAESRKIYPFSFRLQQSYRVKDNRLDVCSRVENLGIEVMYFALGGHPGFYLPFSKKQAISDYAIHFPKQEAMMEKVRFSKDLLTLEERENFALVNGRLPLETVLFRNDAVVLAHSGGELLLGSDDEPVSLRFLYEDYPYIALWQPYGEKTPFLCVEPWTSLPGREGVMEELCSMKDRIALGPDEAKSFCYSIILEDK